MTIRYSGSYLRQRLPSIFILLLVLSACEEPFRPELDGFDAVLVIDGAITDKPGPYTIKLSSSSGLYASDQRPVEGAAVRIVEEGGEEETLTESQPGVYISSENGMQGETGKRYKLSIQLQNEIQYESDYQVMPSPILIDSVGADVVSRYISIDEPDIPGYQFYVTTELAEESENYFLWTLESTHKYSVDFTLDFLYAGGTVEAYPNPTEFMTCWRTDQINKVYTFNTAVLTEPKVDRLPLHFARADKRELLIRYSLLVRQFTISEEAYAFWNNIQRQIESQATLFNNQPFQIRGNLFNIDNPDETVLGYFMVAAEDEKRVFVDPVPGLDVQNTFCEPDYMSYGFLGLFAPARWPIYIYEDITGRRAIANDECFDCRELGGTTVRPEFWMD